MQRRITTNVNSEKSFLVKIMPLFIKNAVMKAVFSAVGEKKSCLSLSNLGKIELPEEMERFVTRMDFVLGRQSSGHYNCGVITYGDTLVVSVLRNIKEPLLERHLHAVLRDLGVKVKVESNQRSDEERK